MLLVLGGEERYKFMDGVGGDCPHLFIGPILNWVLDEHAGW